MGISPFFDVIVRQDHRNGDLSRELLQKTVEHTILKTVKDIELYCPNQISEFDTKSGFEVSDSKLHRLRRESNLLFVDLGFFV